MSGGGITEIKQVTKCGTRAETCGETYAPAFDTAKKSPHYITVT